MKQPGFFDMDERLARLSGLGDRSKRFLELWILRRSVLI